MCVCGATVRRDDHCRSRKQSPSRLQLTCLERCSALELDQLSSQYVKTNSHQSLPPMLGCLLDPHRPSASDFVSFTRRCTQTRLGGSCRRVSGLHRSSACRLCAHSFSTDRTSHHQRDNHKDDNDDDDDIDNGALVELERSGLVNDGPKGPLVVR